MNQDIYMQNDETALVMDPDSESDEYVLVYLYVCVFDSFRFLTN